MENQQDSSPSAPLDDTTSLASQFQTPSTQENTNMPQSYVSVAKKAATTSFPKKEQAVIINVIESLKLVDYLNALSEFTDPKSILFASRISNNRVCIYLSSTDIVDLLVSKHRIIKIGNEQLEIRRLVTPSKRVILSNVCPSIPHDVIESSLRNSGLKLLSPISFLRAGLSDDKFSHILSFRRQVYITPPELDNTEFQTSLVIAHEGTNYRIFLSLDSMECFVCRQTGHIASNCPHAEKQEQTTPQEQTNVIRKRPPPSISSTSNTTSTDLLDFTPETDMLPPVTTPIQLHAPPTILSKEIKPKSKKRKTSPNVDSFPLAADLESIDVLKRTQKNFQFHPRTSNHSWRIQQEVLTH